MKKILVVSALVLSVLTIKPSFASDAIKIHDRNAAINLKLIEARQQEAITDLSGKGQDKNWHDKLRDFELDMEVITQKNDKKLSEASIKVVQKNCERIHEIHQWYIKKVYGESFALQQNIDPVSDRFYAIYKELQMIEVNKDKKSPEYSELNNHIYEINELIKFKK